MRVAARSEVKSNFAAEGIDIASAPAARAFRMIDTDNSIITGSIKPQAPEAPSSLEQTTPTPAKRAAGSMVSPAEEPVKSSTVTTRDILDMLAEPSAAQQAPAKTSESAQEPAVAPPVIVKQASENRQPAARSQAEPAVGQRPKELAPFDIAIPDTIKPADLAAAARAGDANALYEIGMRYQEGRGLKKNATEAAFWLELAADRGSAPAAFQLGSLYEKGAGVDKDTDKAVTLYRKAAEAGNVSAMHNLAVMLANGAGIDVPDFAEAAKWFRAAADHGIADSQFNLAILHARGVGVDADLVQSYKWFAIAAINGDAEAAKRRNEVTEALSDADLNRGKTLAAEWQAEEPVPTANRAVIPADWMPQEALAATVDKQAIVRDIQVILNDNGFDAGPADGLLGAKTDAAIKAFQKASGLTADGAVTPQLVEALLERNSA
nr:peptidoglycan-binding protein [Marinicella sp. W31]MDC2879100.1 peptidoglycan-binding protein [Marinicella sp. W31]